MKTTLVLVAALLASASAFAPAPMARPALRSARPSAMATKMEFEITDGTPYKLSVAPVGAFGFAGWVSPRGIHAACRLVSCVLMRAKDVGCAGVWASLTAMFARCAGCAHHPDPVQHPPLWRQGTPRDVLPARVLS